MFCIRGSPNLVISVVSLPHAIFVMYFSWSTIFHTPENNLTLVLLLTYEDLKSFLIVFLTFTLVVPHSPRPISCVFSYADVYNEREHLGASQRKHSYSTITRTTMLNDFEQKNKR